MCANHKKDDKESCSFMIGSIASVRLKEAQVKELLTKKKTEVISGFVAKTGMKFDAPLKLTEEGEIAFDFPEKPKPEETTVPCPKCGKMLMKTQWRYECVCGFKIWHTVAKVELSEEVMKELNSGKQVATGHYGLTNVQRRCALLFGPDFAMTFTNAAAGGAVVEMYIPLPDAAEEAKEEEKHETVDRG